MSGQASALKILAALMLGGCAVTYALVARGCNESLEGQTAPQGDGGDERASLSPLSDTVKPPSTSDATDAREILGLGMVSGGVTLDGDYPAIYDDRENIYGGMVLKSLGSDGDPQSLNVRVEGLKWKAELLSNREYEVTELHLRGLKATLVDESQRVSASQTVVRAQLKGGAFLRVVDRTTGEDLRNVSVRIPASWTDAFSRVPEDFAGKRALIASADSPVRLPDGEENFLFWVGAPGYAWEKVSIGVGQESLTCSLEREGSLEVRLPIDAEGRPSELQAMLRGREPDGAWAIHSQRRVGRSAPSVELERLLPGSYEFFLGVLVRPDDSAGMGATPDARRIQWLEPLDVQIRPGARTVVDGPDRYPWTKAGGLQGTVHVPADLVDYLDEHYSIIIVRLPDEGEKETPPVVLSRRDCGKTSEGVLWGVHSLRAGTYRVVLLPHGLEGTIEVLPLQNTVLELRFSDCEFVPIRVLGAPGSSEMTATISWRLRGDSYSIGNRGICSLKLGGASGGIMATPGTIDYLVVCPGWKRVDGTVASRVGATEVLVRMERSKPSRVRIAVSSNGGPVLLPIGYYGKILFENASGDRVRHSYEPGNPEATTTYGYTSDSASAVLVLDDPGEYRCIFPDLPGYHPAPIMKVDVSDTTSSVLELVLESVYD